MCMCADNVLAAWVFFAVLTWVHVWANIRALRCLVLSSLNQPRLKLLLHHYMAQVRGPTHPVVLDCYRHCWPGLVASLVQPHLHSLSHYVIATYLQQTNGCLLDGVTGLGSALVCVSRRRCTARSRCQVWRACWCHP